MGPMDFGVHDFLQWSLGGKKVVVFDVILDVIYIDLYVILCDLNYWSFGSGSFNLVAVNQVY